MTKYTPNLNLYKPNVSDEIPIDTSLSENFQKIDNEAARVASQLVHGAQQVEALNDKTDKIVIPRRHLFGGQLQKLKESLSNPLEQFTGIVFIGDSITWGRTLPENGTFDPRDGTLSDPRDNFISPSFVNEFKRYVGSEYCFGAPPVLSNWQASSSGEAIAEFTVQNILYPRYADFEVYSVGGAVSLSEAQTALSITGYQLALADGNVAGTSYQGVKFKFTGDAITLSFGVVDSDATWYDLIVDGVLIGTYQNKSGVDGFNQGNDQRRTHTFSYVRDKIVEIRSNRNGENTGNRRLRLEGIIINKKVRIINQGINGATTNSYKLYNLAGNTFGDGEAVNYNDNFVFCQFGTNDRLIRSNVPRGSNAFRRNLQDLLDVVTPLSNVILMCANPVTNESTSQYSFNMQRARDVIYRTAKKNNMDMIDNYAIFNGFDLGKVTADGVHPNRLGMRLIFKNIINSLENN